MRVTTYAWGIAASATVTVAWFAGCGGSVNEVTGGTGNGGHPTTTTVSTGTGATTTTSTPTGGTTTVSTVTTTTSSTGTTPCDMACAHAQMCGFDVCGMFNINCATVGSQYDCAFECINNVSCQNLLSQGMAFLQATCTDGGTGDAGPGDAAPADGGATCQSCAETSCTSALGACAADTSCLGWLQCANACSTPSCYQACDAMYPTASSEYAAVYSCACTNCSTECATENPCAAGMDGGP